MADHAVLIDVQPNPVSFPELQGTGNDVDRFRDWLIAQDGGGVPAANVHIAGHPAPPKHVASEAGIRTAFRPLVELVGRDGPVEDRLFVYASGHGCGDKGNSWDIGIIPSDADHVYRITVAINRYVDFLFRSRRFRQIVFIADCCRDVDVLWPITPPPLPEMLGSNGVVNTKVFECAAAIWGVQAKEGEFDGVWHGYFTKALLEAFDYASGNAQGRLTGTEVARYVHARIANWQERAPLLPIPEFQFNPIADVDFGQAREIPFPVTFSVGPSMAGRNARLLFDGQGAPVDEMVLAAGHFTWGMKPGLYILEVEGTQYRTPVSVPTDTSIHVQ